MLLRPLLLVLAAASLLCAQQDRYSGPVPPQADLPYLLHATKLVPTEAGSAKEDQRKDYLAYVVASAASPARTPLAEPIFIMKAGKLDPTRLELYKMDSRNGQREVLVPTAKKKGGAARALHMSITPLGEGLYKLEVAEPLANGEYSLTPSGSNEVFCFQVY
jgi:hypothetical protein